MLRKRPLILAEVHAVAARVRSSTGGKGNSGTRNGRRHDLRQLADAIVLLIAANVEHLVVDELARRLENREEGSRYVRNVDDRTPRRTVALQHHLFGGERPGHEVVEDQVK